MRLLPHPNRRPIGPRPAPRTRLGGLERLEDRVTPAAPSLTMNAHAAAGGMLEIAGRVRDEAPGQAVVAFSGAVSGMASPDANGYYRVQLTQTGTGAVLAQATDAEGLSSPVRTDDEFLWDNQPPVIFVTYAQRAGHSVLIEGFVMDDSSEAYLPVTLGGVVSGSTTTDVDGNFSVTLTASALGEIEGVVMDDEGALSDVYSRTITNVKPEILSFGAAQGTGGAWVISGTVNDEWAPQLSVTIHSGIPGLNGTVCKVRSDGTFSTIFYPLSGFLGGAISATVTDGWGFVSDEVFSYVG